MNSFRSFTEVQHALLNSTTNCVEITRSYLKKIDQEKKLNCFIEVYSEEALKQAVFIDKKIKKGSSGRLAGMIVGIKDNLCYKKHKVSAASKILSGFESLFTATAVEKLIEEDAIIIGRLNCDEFAMGSANENTIYGPVRNPINIFRNDLLAKESRVILSLRYKYNIFFNIFFYYIPRLVF